jgi:hypothetical protein
MAEVIRYLLYLVFYNIDAIDIKNAEFGMASPSYHPPVVTNLSAIIESYMNCAFGK